MNNAHNNRRPSSRPVSMSSIIKGKIKAHKGLISKARKSGDKGAVTAANKRIRQLKKDLYTEQLREIKAA